MSTNLEFRSVARSHTGLVRPTNEDAFIARDGLWAVADGLGGHADGEVASGLITRYLDAVPLVAVGRHLDSDVGQALQEAHREILLRNAQGDQPSDMASTVAILCVEGRRYSCMWAGDSRIYRLRRQELTQLSRDHRLVQEMLDAGVIEETEAMAHRNRNVLTRAVGIDPAFQIDRVEGELLEGDTFLLATDGVSDVCSGADIAGILESNELDAAADALVELCLSRGGPDNLTFVLVTVTSRVSELES